MPAHETVAVQEARAQRAREIRDGALSDKDLMDQVHSASQPHAPRMPWRQLQAECNARDE